MIDDISHIQREIVRLRQGRPRTAVRYPATLQRTITALARERRGRGGSIAAVARELHLPRWTLNLWLRTPAAPLMRTVAVLSDAAPAPVVTGAVLIMPDGVRVEGARVETLTTLLRALR